MIKSLLNKFIPEKLKNTIRDKAGVPSQKSSLKRIKGLGFDPNYCLDIGAYEGAWASDFNQIFPKSVVLMIEGQNEKEPFIAKTKEKLKQVDYRMALLGATESTVTFNKYETASSVLDEHYDTPSTKESRKLVTLDSLVEGTDFSKPDFIKIDTQGYELEILKGGEKTLSAATFVLLEVSFLDIYKNCPLVEDVLSFMKERGFVVYDICTIMRRPLDAALFQSDFLFAKENSDFRKDKRWI